MDIGFGDVVESPEGYFGKADSVVVLVPLEGELGESPSGANEDLIGGIAEGSGRIAADTQPDPEDAVHNAAVNHEVYLFPRHHGYFFPFLVLEVPLQIFGACPQLAKSLLDAVGGRDTDCASQFFYAEML